MQLKGTNGIRHKKKEQETTPAPITLNLTNYEKQNS